MKKLLILLTMLAGLTGFSKDNSRTITGTVYSNDDKLPLPGVTVKIVGTSTGIQTDGKGAYKIAVPDGDDKLQFSLVGYKAQIVKLGKKDKVDVYLVPSSMSLNEVVVMAGGVSKKDNITGSVMKVRGAASAQQIRIDEPVGNSDVKSVEALQPTQIDQAIQGRVAGLQINGDKTAVFKRNVQLYGYNNNQNVSNESYAKLIENKYQNPIDNPLSTFSVDVDGASYANIRRFINGGQLPPKDAVRIEEMINYFKYQLPEPKDNGPVAITTELSAAPWNPNHRLLRIGLKARTIPVDKLPASNLVFLIDVSGSMDEPNKLPLVKQSIKMLVDQLRAQDNVAIVVYAGNAGLVLPATAGNEKEKINDAIDNLSAGGSTAGGAGIKLAYKIALENFKKGGNNRIVMATDGDFNVGASSDESMEQLITKERDSGVDLSIIGFGMGNYKDSKMETLADKGNGNYAYIDNLTEAHKALVSEFGGTMFTVAKDVKLQIEFNPAKVQAYRLIGYENRLLNKEDFNNDKKDAGDMGSGHTVTAFYEIVPAGIKDDYAGSVDALKYQKVAQAPVANNTNEMLTVKFRYKEPQGLASKVSQVTVNDTPKDFEKQSADYRFAAAVAEIGMVLRDSEFKGNASYEQGIKIAKAAKGNDEEGYRSEFVRLAESARLMVKGDLTKN